MMETLRRLGSGALTETLTIPLATTLKGFLRRKPFKVVASGIVSVSVKAPLPNRRKVSIIVPAYNEAATFEPVLRSILEKRLEGLDKEVVIVESNSTDGTREIVLKYRSEERRVGKERRAGWSP